MPRSAPSPSARASATLRWIRSDAMIAASAECCALRITVPAGFAKSPSPALPPPFPPPLAGEGLPLRRSSIAPSPASGGGLGWGREIGCLRLAADEQFDGGGVGDGVVRGDAALVGDVEAGEGVDQEPGGVRGRHSGADVERDAHRRPLAKDRRRLRSERLPTGG